MLKRYAMVVLALLASVALATAEERAEFHQTYPLTGAGEVAVHNINGSIHVTAWDRNEVKVDAVKHGRSQQDLDEAQIVVDASAGSVDIRTKYPERDHRDHSASVDYTITVPSAAVLDPVESVNGGVIIDGVTGKVRANSVNGNVEVRRAGGDVDASAVNGKVEADFDRMPARHISLNTVNGGIVLGLPQNAGAHVQASTVHGGISSDFDMPVRHVAFGPGSSLDTRIGDGAAEVKLTTVNGGINLTRR
jgi:DUF4097 and DUF4098 domain-containing protein YvlB